MNNGKVYIVGAGPGDPELITVKGLRAIQEADVILYDRLINNDLLGYAKRSAELIYCGKLPNYYPLQQETIHKFLIKYAKNGNVVTRLKGGDPFVFGRGAEEAEVLQAHNISFEIVPGITAGIAAPAYAGIPVTHRQYSGSVAIVTGHRQSGEVQWENIAKGIDTIVIYMGMRNLAHICEQLVTHGRGKQTPVAIIHWGTKKEQRTVTGTLSDIVEKVSTENVTNPAIIVIGEVVKLNNKLSWYQHELANIDLPLII
ncbi:uroporphyrinogen-III C-methyltransferase [Pueribacillus sp. YX66]|uniref:uroporphyrinogen-III C-methyltransferase n=1 Tax=Pueribacillus sp. YX66 TaxID=3229242 RepID=UPI00358D459C